MIHWNSETDARVHHIKLSAPALEQISKIMTAGMGPNCKGGCTPKAISHRIAKIKILGTTGSSAPNTPSKPRRSSSAIKQENLNDIDTTSLNKKLAGFKRERSHDDDNDEEANDNSYDDVSSPNPFVNAGSPTPTPKCTPRKPKSTTTTPRKRTKKTQQSILMMPLEAPTLASLYESTSDTSSSCDYHPMSSHSFPPQPAASHITMDMMYHSFNPDPYNNYTDVDEAVATSWLQELAPHDLPPFNE